MPTGALITSLENEALDLIKSTAPLFIADYVDETIRHHTLLAMMRRDGSISTGYAGQSVVYDVKYKQPTVVSYADRNEINYNSLDLHKQLGLNWGGYVVTTALHLKTQLMNSGGLEIVKKTTDDVDSLLEALTDHLSKAIYEDGSASDNDLKGLESFLTFTTPAATDILATPNDTYGGADTDLAAEGSWSSDLATSPNATLATDWPHGQGTTTYAWNSPIGINWSSSAFGTGSVLWEDNCERAIRQGIIWLTKNGGNAGRPNVVLMPSDLFTGYLNHQSAKQRIIIPHKGSQDLGFEDGVNQEGVAIHTDYNCPASTAYMLNTKNTELRALGDTLIGQYGPHDWPVEAAKLFAVFSFPQMCFRPRHVAKLKNFA